MTDIPARVCIEPDSPFFYHGFATLGVRWQAPDGTWKDRTDVVEFDRNAGWIRFYVKDGRGHAKKSRGRYVTVKSTRPFEVHRRVPT